MTEARPCRRSGSRDCRLRPRRGRLRNYSAAARRGRRCGHKAGKQNPHFVRSPMNEQTRTRCLCLNLKRHRGKFREISVAEEEFNGTRPLRDPLTLGNRDGGGAMRAQLGGDDLAIVMAMIGIVLTDRRRLAGEPWRLALLSDRRNPDAGLRLVPVPRPAARRLDLYRPVHPERHLGLCGSARQRLGDGAVAGRAAGDADRRCCW